MRRKNKNGGVVRGSDRVIEIVVETGTNPFA